MALDWTTAESYTHGLARAGTSRLSTLPRDVVNAIAPYLHTHTYAGCPYRDGRIHGTHSCTPSGYVGVYETRDGKIHGASKWWYADGSMYTYSEYDTGRLMFRIHWGDTISVYDGGWKHHDTLPDEYRWVWESMTRSI